MRVAEGAVPDRDLDRTASGRPSVGRGRIRTYFWDRRLEADAVSGASVPLAFG